MFAWPKVVTTSPVAAAATEEEGAAAADDGMTHLTNEEFDAAFEGGEYVVTWEVGPVASD